MTGRVRRQAFGLPALLVRSLLESDRVCGWTPIPRCRHSPSHSIASRASCAGVRGVVLLEDRPRRGAASSACGPATGRARVCVPIGRRGAGLGKCRGSPRVSKASVRAYHQEPVLQPSLLNSGREGGRRNADSDTGARKESSARRVRARAHCARSETRVGSGNDRPSTKASLWLACVTRPVIA